jgi:hypothetical protein
MDGRSYTKIWNLSNISIDWKNIDWKNKWHLPGAKKLPNGRMHGLAPEPVLKRLFVSRAFTCHQMSALITERLGPELRRFGAQRVIILGLLYTFCDDDVPEKEAHALFKKTMDSLQGISQEGYYILVAEHSFQRPALRMEKLLTSTPLRLPKTGD